MSQTIAISPWRCWLKQHSLLAYFILAFSISWLFELPVVLSHAGLGWLPYNVPPLLANSSPGVPLGPTGAAFILTALLEGKVGVMRLLKRYVQWRVSLKWYLLILLGSPLLMLLSASVFSAPHLQRLPFFLSSYSTHLLIALAINWEEGGWRGFALPRLQKLAGPLWGSLILGFMWGTWHLPLMFIPTQSPYGHTFTWALALFFFMQIMAKSVNYTWIFNNTGGSLLMATLIHAATSINAHDIEQLFGATGALMAQAEAALAYGCLPYWLLP